MHYQVLRRIVEGLIYESIFIFQRLYAMIYHNSRTTKTTFKLNVTSSENLLKLRQRLQEKKFIYRLITTVQHCRLVCVHYNFLVLFLQNICAQLLVNTREILLDLCIKIRKLIHIISPRKLLKFRKLWVQQNPHQT